MRPKAVDESNVPDRRAAFNVQIEPVDDRIVERSRCRGPGTKEIPQGIRECFRLGIRCKTVRSCCSSQREQNLLAGCLTGLNILPN